MPISCCADLNAINTHEYAKGFQNYADYSASGINLSDKETAGGWAVGTMITADTIQCWHDITVRKTSSADPYRVWRCLNTLFERTGGVPVYPDLK